MVCSEVPRVGPGRLGQMQHTIFWSSSSKAQAAGVDGSGAWMDLVAVGGGSARGGACAGLPHRDVVRMLRSAPRPLELQLTSLAQQPLDKPQGTPVRIAPPVESPATAVAENR